MKAVIEDGTIVLRLPFFQNFIAKSAGARWHPATKTWRCSPNPLVAALLTAALPREEISDDILILNDAPVAIPNKPCLLYTSPSPRDGLLSRMPSSA